MNFIAEVLERHIKENPNHHFIFDEKNLDGITFAQLYDLSGRVYAYLKANNIGKEDFVLINLTRGIKPFIALIGVIRSGAAFTIVENTDPIDRIKYIYDNCNCKLEINEEVFEDILKTEPLSGFEDVAEHDAAYAVYTSGTTGNPKGIIHEYGNLKEACESFYYNKEPIFAEDENFAFISSFNFAALTMYCIPVFNRKKSKIHIIANSIKKDSEKLLSYLKENNITGIFLPPSYIRAIGEEKLSFLKRLFIGSEPINGITPPEGVTVYNTYGMSESGFWVGLFKIDKKYDIYPVGQPQFDKKVYLLDEKGEQVPDGETGELCFDNPFVRGYINLPEENERAFQNGIYHSNDLAKRLPTGDYVIIGRKNDMVKINGNRVEPAEVEAVIRNELNIDWCGVRGFEGDENAYLAAYYIADISFDINELRERLSKKLPYYMIPAHFIKIDKIPVNKNGKFDRKALPVPEFRAEEIVLPETDFEKQIFDVVAKELKTKEFGVTTNLISMGLTSIKAIKLSASISKETNYSIKSGDILAKPYIREWINFVDKNIEKIEILSEQKTYPITSNQLGIYIDWEQNRDGLQYNIPSALNLGNIEPKKLLNSLNKVIKAHPYFKIHLTQDSKGEVVQVRRDNEELSVIFEKLDNEPDNEFFQSRVRPFNLLGDDLSRFEIYYTENNTYLFFDIHHILFDGTSANILLSELLNTYEGKELTTEQATAFDYSLFLENWEKSEDYKKAEKYFEELISDTESFMYPSKNANAQATGKSGAFVGEVAKQGIKNYCSKLGITENAFFASVLVQVFHRISREENIQISTISSGRSLEQLTNTIGMFVQTLPLVANNFKGNVVDILKSTQEQIISTINNDKFPYTKLVEKYNAKPNILYAYQGDVIDKTVLSKFEKISLNTDTVITPISINITPENDTYSLSFEYDKGLYTKDEIEKLSFAISNFATNLAKQDVKAQIENISLVSEKEEKDLIALGTGEKLNYDTSKTFVDLFIEQAKTNPETTAVIDYKSSITYGELDRKSNILANVLIKKGIKNSDFVGVKLPRIKEFMLSVIAIWKAGGAYVPIDPEYPTDRINYMIEDSASKVVIDEEFLANIDFNVDVEPINLTTPKNLAYMIYTSGSTGKPKGVMISQESLAAFVTWLTKELELKQGDNVAEYSSFSFDASLCDLYTSLAKGSTLHILGSDLIKDFVGLEKYITKNKIVGATLPTQLGMDFINASNTDLKYLILGGDKLKLTKETPIRIYNGYGPTEFTVWATSHIVDFKKDMDNIPIGRPIPNSIVAVVDENGNLLPEEMEGELVLIGRQISKGYWNRLDLTEEKFVDSPFLQGQKMYKTGDLVRWNENNELLFIGRIDNQVKLRGFRIELGEIESVLSKIYGIKSSVAEVKTINDIQHLIAYYISDNELNESDLKQKLSKTLTGYMIPDIFVRLDKMPLTPNGKVNRKALPIPELRAEEYIAPIGETEETIALNMQDVLNISTPVGRSDSFLALGGDSIKSIRLVSKLREAGIVVSVSDIMKAKTVEGIAALSKKEATFKADQTNWSGEVELTAIQKEFFDSWKLTTPNHFNQSLMFAASSCIDKDILLKALEKLVCHHDMLRTTYKDGVQYVRKPENEGEFFTLDVVETDDNALIERKANELQTSFDIENGPLFKACVFKKTDADYLFLVIHHLVVDGVSWRILIEDLENIYKQIENNQDVKLPHKTMSFRDWSLAIRRFADSELLKKEVDYWKNVEAQTLNTKYTEKRSLETSHIDRTLPTDTFNLLRGKALEAYNTEINDLLLTALGRAYKSVMGENVLSVQLETHGREEINEQTQIDRTIGWFTSICPVIVESHEDIRKNIFHIKEELRRIPNHGIGYGILKHFTDDLSNKQVIPTLIFNYLGIFKEGGKNNLFNIDYTLPLGNPIAKNNIFGPAMAINCFGTTDNSLKIWFDYDTSIWNKDNAGQFADMFIEEINNIIEHTLNVAAPEHTASDLGENSWSNKEFCNVIADFKVRNEEIERIYPLTSMQSGMLLKAITEPNSSAYHVSTSIGLDILPTEEQVTYAFNKLLDKHEVLKTSIIYKDVSAPRQAIISGRETVVDIIDISDSQDISKAMKDLEQSLFDAPIDLQYSPLFKLTCAKTGGNSSVLIFVMHHIIADGWCNSIFVNDFITFLTEAIENNKKQEDFTNNKGRFEKFVRELLSKDTTKAREYWNNLLEGYEIKTEIVPFEKVTEENKATSEEMNISLSIEDTDKLKETCNKVNCTINNAVEAAIGILLQKYNRVDDSLFVKVVSGRDNTSEDISDLIGMCLNSVPVRVKTAKDDSILDLLNKVQQQSVETSKYDWYPLSSIQAESELKNNLFQIIYAFENYETNKKTTSSFNAKLSGKETNIADIGLAAFLSNNALTINVKFDTDKFAKIEIERVMFVLQNILSAFANKPETKVSSVSLITKEEEKELITLGTGKKLDYDNTQTFVDLFIKQAKTNPETLAVVDYKSSITYSELDRKSNILANELIKKGIKPNDFVAAKLPRIKEFMLSVLGIFKAGGAYVPIDSEYPINRINYMIEDCESKVVIDEEFLANIDFNQYVEPINLATPSTLAYMIYTSGSTGKPKGVMLTHSNLKCFITWLSNMVHIKPNDCIGEYVSFCFDGSTGDLFPSLANGATLHIFSSELRKDIIQLKEYISQNKIRGMVLITSMAMAILDDGKVDLDYMLVGGEPVIPFKPTNINFYNVYGPTEFTNMSVVGLVDQTFPYSSVPIGRPVPNTTAAVIDENNNLLPRGIEGELALIGPQLSRGYLKRPDLTKEKFVDCPFMQGQKMYKTGDLVRWNKNNELLFIGRIDNQVKLRGFRIELGEIESVLSKIEDIKSSVVEVKTINDIQHLVVYYVSDEKIDEDKLKEELSKSLTDYMVPDIFVRLDKMPLNPNGKVDRALLPIPELKAQNIVLPETEFEKEIFDIVANELQTKHFGITTNLISMGLTSIKAIKLSAIIKKETNYYIKTSDILAKPYIKEWVNLIDKENEKIEISEKQKTYTLTPNQLGIYIDWERNRDGLQYNIPMALKLNNTEPKKLLDSLNKVIELQPYFKAHIIQNDNGEIVQERRDNEELQIVFEKLDKEPDREFFQQKIKSFNLLGDDLSRFEICYTENNTYLFMDVHHILFDGASLNIFLSELLSYEGKELNLEKVTAYDYSLHLENWKKSEDYKKSEKYFDELISDTESFTYPASNSNAQATGKNKIFVSEVSRQDIKDYCSKLGITENAFFASVLAQVFHRISREESIQIATISNGRSNEQLTNTIGMFVQTLPLVSKKSSGNIADLLKSMQEQIISTINNDKYPYTKLVEKYGIKPNILYAYQGDVINDENSFEQIPLELDTAKMPISINIIPKEDSYSFVFEYDEGLYTQDEIEKLSTSISNFANNLIKQDINAQVETIPLVSEKEEQELITLGTGEELDYDNTQTFIDLFIKQVKTNPETIAIVDYNSSITYEELDRQSNVLANELIKKDVKNNNFVAVKLPRIKEFMTSVIAIWKSGAAYVPIDTEYPAERINYMIEDSASKVVIDEEFLSNVDFNQEVENINLATPNNLAYMIYTSGSTGKPKGVMIPHANLTAFCTWRTKLLQVNSDNFAHYTSFSFDASMDDFVVPLSTGSTIHILNEATRTSMNELYNYIVDNKITILTLPTKLGIDFANEYNNLPIKFLTMGGEKITCLKETKFNVINGYGPTEFTVCSSLHIIDFKKDTEDIPIGRPVANSISAIVDSNGNLLPRGVNGELVLIGKQISKGYWNRADLTEEKFVDCPFLQGQKMYKTGDLVRWNKDNELMFIGRIDNQVKLRGFRIELGEIESALSKIKGIKSSVVEVKTINDIQHLIAYYVSDKEINENTIKQELSKSLTSYMVPDMFVHLDKMPLTPNGKIDRKALEYLQTENISENFVAPATETEKTICSIFGNILNIENFSAVGDFFKLGGTSITAIRAIGELQKNNFNIVYGDIFKYKTPKTLASYFESSKNEQKNNSNDEIENFDYSKIDTLLKENNIENFLSGQTFELKNVLLTGATGFLGIHILVDFLQHEKGKIYCLLRKGRFSSVKERLTQLLMYYFGENIYSQYEDRIITIEGDITDKNTFKNLENLDVCTVFNCAANVKHYSHDDNIKQVNYYGVLNLIELCKKKKFRLIQTSTTSISGFSINDSLPINTKLDEQKLYFKQNLDNKYIYSKFLAERQILDEIAKGNLDGKIMRLGNLSSRNTDGEFQINSTTNSFMNRFRAYNKLGCYPYSAVNEAAELSPIDCVARAIMLLSTTPKQCTVFHPFNNHIIRMGDIITIMQNNELKVDFVENDKYIEALKQVQEKEENAEVLSSIIAYQDIAHGNKVQVVETLNNYTTQILYRLGYTMPITEQIYINKVFDSIISLGFFE